MAGLRTCHKLPPAGKGELAGRGPNKSSGTPFPSLAASCVPIPMPAQASEALAPTPGQPGRYTNEDLQSATKLAVKSFVNGQEYGQLQISTTPREQPLKAWFLDLYYGNSHLDCYCFYSQFRRVSQYQQESLLEWAAHLEHLRSILLEYDPIGAPTEPTMLKYFRKGSRLSILAEVQNEDLELKSFVQIVKKTVIAKAKTSLRPWATIWDMDQQCP